ncbi:MAG: hypothetical protein I8H68_07000 [Flavobacteriia bacterium]|nr:hypothetical protein [Flavobacteriia bacterium]MBH2023108.1 hypothetical protein [Flavobacteriales bacterium]
MKTLIAILVAFFLANHTSAQHISGITGKIKTENKEGLLKITATAINKSSIHHSLNYILVSVKKGKNGSSSNKQSGKFSLKPNETKTLAETNLNLTKQDALKVYLFVKDEESDELLSKDSLEVNPEKFSSAVSYIPESSIELVGLTIDETKTRLGQLFYESFFKKYNQIPKKFEGTVTISELPSFGRNSRIIVTQDDQMIHSFLTRPDEESIDAEADRAVANLAEYNSRNSLKNKEFKY